MNPERLAPLADVYDLSIYRAARARAAVAGCRLILTDGPPADRQEGGDMPITWRVFRAADPIGALHDHVYRALAAGAPCVPVVVGKRGLAHLRRRLRVEVRGESKARALTWVHVSYPAASRAGRAP